MAYWTKRWSPNGYFNPRARISNTTSRPASGSTKRIYKETEREGARGLTVAKDTSLTISAI